MNLALISPANGAYSETFIRAHVERLSGSVYYYYGGHIPSILDGYGAISPHGVIGKARNVLTRAVTNAITAGRFTNKELSLYRSLKGNSIDVVLAEYGTTGASVLNVCKLLNMPLIVHLHGYDISVKNVLEEYASKYRSLFAYAHRIVVVSEPMRKAVKRFGASDCKILYAPCGPREFFANVIPTYSEKAFVSVGRFVDKKAPYYTILSFAKVCEKHSDAMLYMAGAGYLLNTCKNLVKQMRLEHNVVFMGIIDSDEFMERLSKVRAFVQHSIIAEDGDMEGNPVAIMEAQAAGVPVVATKHAGIPEVVINGETGILVDEHDVDGMARALLRLLDDVDLAKKYGRSAKNRMKEHFTIDRHINALNEAIANAAQNMVE